MPAPDAGPVWVELEAPRSLVGRLEELVFKPAPLLIEATLADGRTVQHRLVPGHGRTGFVLSPYIADRAAFAKLASPSWRTTLAGDRVTSIRVTAVDDDLGGYSGDVSGSFSSALYRSPTP